MQCFVYRSTRRPDTYVFVPRADDFTDIPDELMRYLGRLDLALELELTPGRRLARTDGRTVIEHIERDGFYVQLPPDPGVPR